MARPVTVLPPAPSLPAPSETPARLPAGEAFRREAVSRDGAETERSSGGPLRRDRGA